MKTNTLSWLALGLVLLLADAAQADVTICKAAAHNSAEATCTAESIATVANGNDPVLWCNSGATDGAPRASCVTRKWYFEKYLPDYARVLTTTAGWQQWSKAKSMFGVTPPPTCPPPQPPNETRLVTCTAPQVGSWNQTRSYTCTAPNWVAGTWAPATPPAGACVTPPPVPVPFKMTVTVTPSVFGQVGAPVMVSWQADDPSVTCLTDFPGAPGGNPGGTTVGIPGPAVTTTEYRIGCIRTADGFKTTYSVALRSEPPPLALIGMPIPACYPTEPGCVYAQSANGRVTTWTVETDTTVVRYRTAYDPAVYPFCADSFVLTHANADRQWGRCQGALRDTDLTTAVTLEKLFAPRYSAVGGPAYVVNSDGTLGPQLWQNGVAVVVATGEPCQLGRKVLSVGKRFMRVSPAMNPAYGGVLQWNAFAECARADAPVGGWPSP